MAYKTFANGFPLPASDLNNYLMNQSVIVFADAAARTAAIASPTEGMVTYLESDNELYKWTGADWVNIAAPSPVTTEGDLIVGDAGGDETRLAIGAADTVLTSNGTTATWEDAAAGAGPFSLLDSGSLPTGVSTVTFSGLSGKTNYMLIINGMTFSGNFSDGTFLINGSGAGNYIRQSNFTGSLTTLDGFAFTTAGTSALSAKISNANVTGFKEVEILYGGGGTGIIRSIHGIHDGISTPLSSLTFTTGSQTITAGTYEIFGA